MILNFLIMILLCFFLLEVFFVFLYVFNELLQISILDPEFLKFSNEFLFVDELVVELI